MDNEVLCLIVKELSKNGVKVIEHDFSIIDTFSPKKAVYSYSIEPQIFDFSEHDKVFEDKIASLEKQIERLMREKQLAYDRSEQLMKTTDVINSANKELKQKISDLESLMQKRDVFLEMKNIQIAELKQRIAELESKESEKTMRIEFHADNGEMLTPLEVANSLITQNTFKVDELKELAEILEVYYRHHRDKNQDLDDLW